MDLSRDRAISLVLLGSVVATIGIYGIFIPRLLSLGDGGRALLYLVVGWVPYTLAFYAIGRFSSSPETLPSMRPADVGLGLFLVSLLISLGLDRWGFSPELVPVGHVVQAVGIYVGLALFGWGIGRRSVAIQRIYGESST